MAPAVKPAPKPFETQVAEKPLEYLLCRLLGHAWDPSTIEVAYGVFELGLLCKRCGTERDRTYDPAQKVRNHYWHPKDQTPYGFDRIGRLTADDRRYIDQVVNDELSRRLPRPRK